VDDGVGQVSQFQTAGRYGLCGMRERAQALGGSFQLTQREPTGVAMRVQFPLTPGPGHV